VVRAFLHPGHLAVESFRQPGVEPSRDERIVARGRDPAGGETKTSGLGLQIVRKGIDDGGVNQNFGRSYSCFAATWLVAFHGENQFPTSPQFAITFPAVRTSNAKAAV
jgi:hypothetical protein